MSIKFKDIRWKKVICEDLTVGEVKEVSIDPSNWKVTHLLVGKTNKVIKLKVKKGQLKIYLRAPKPK